MNKVNEIMDILNNINYGFLDGNNKNILDESNFKNLFSKIYYLLSPEELLEKKYGVCWDQVELERKLFNDTDIPFKTYFIYTNDHNYLPSHTFLVYENNNKYYWFEHSWNDEKGIHEYNTLNDLLNEVEKKHILAHKDEINGEFDTFIYEYSKPNYNISCDEFYGFIFKQKRIYNYKFQNATTEDIGKIKEYKLKSIIDYISSESENEINKIKTYIEKNIPKQINDYKKVIYNNKVIGCLLVINKKDEILLDELFIENEYRNKGIATSIIKNIINNSNKNITLWVYKNNDTAYKLYLKLGFENINESDTRYKLNFKK